MRACSTTMCTPQHLSHRHFGVYIKHTSVIDTTFSCIGCVGYRVVNIAYGSAGFAAAARVAWLCTLLLSKKGAGRVQLFDDVHG